jgi:tetratricopeptide (TPR) repeat protein
MTKTHTNIIVIVFFLFFACNQKKGDYYIKEGNKFATSGDYKMAIKNFSDAIKIDSNDAHAYELRGTAYLWSGKLDSALSDLSTAINIDSSYDAETYVKRGWLYLGIAKVDSATSDFNMAIKIKPELLSSYAGIAGLYAAKNQLDSALASINYVIQKDSLYSDIFVSKGMIFGIRGGIYKLLNQKDKAIADFKTAADIGLLEASEVLKNEFNIDYPAKP